MKRITVTVRPENWKKYTEVKARFLLRYPDEPELTFTEFMNLALRNFEATALTIFAERRKVKKDA